MKEITEKVKKLILKDMDNDIVPKTITSFDDLQSYVDANMYFIESGFKLNTKGWVGSLNQHIDEIHKWLESRNQVEYTCENETCRLIYVGDYNSGYCSDECKG
tara:strand:+ start:373 stop:681 length:309 start_codon:yes stop_codon:yes gene_type:complete